MEKRLERFSVEPKYENACAISSAREERGLSQKQLSGITQCDISRIEGGVANPTIETPSKLRKVLDIELNITKQLPDDENALHKAHRHKRMWFKADYK